MMAKHPWLKVRQLFDLDPEYAHLAGFWLSSHPQPVRESIARHRDALDRNPLKYVLDNEQQLERESRERLAEFIGGDETEIVLTRSTTEGLAIVVDGLTLTADDSMITTWSDHYSLIRVVERVHRRTGAAIDRVNLCPSPPDTSSKEILIRLLSAIQPTTRLVAITWVHSSTGVALPIREIGDAIRLVNAEREESRRILLCVDATHAVGALDFDVSELGCDILVGSLHKWMHGPRGTAFVWVNQAVLPELDPPIPSFAEDAISAFMAGEPQRPVRHAMELSPGGFYAFEHRWSIPAAVKLMTDLDMPKVEGRIKELASRLKFDIAQVDGVKLLTPMSAELSAGIVCFLFKDVQSSDAARKLRSMGVLASASPYASSCVRFSCAVYNTPEDIAQGLAAVTEVAAAAG